MEQPVRYCSTQMEHREETNDACTVQSQSISLPQVHALDRRVWGVYGCWTDILNIISLTVVTLSVVASKIMWFGKLNQLGKFLYDLLGKQWWVNVLQKVKEGRVGWWQRWRQGWCVVQMRNCSWKSSLIRATVEDITTGDEVLLMIWRGGGFLVAGEDVW